MMEYKEIIENIFQTTPHFWDLYRYLENEGRVCYSTLLLHSVSQIQLLEETSILAIYKDQHVCEYDEDKVNSIMNSTVDMDACCLSIVNEQQEERSPLSDLYLCSNHLYVTFKNESTGVQSLLVSFPLFL